MTFSRSKAKLFSCLNLLDKIKSENKLPEKTIYKVHMAYNYIGQAMDEIQEYVYEETRGILNQQATNEILQAHVKDGHE